MYFIILIMTDCFVRIFLKRVLSHSKLFVSPLQGPSGLCCLGKLIAVYMVTEMHCGQSVRFRMLQQVLHILNWAS